MAGRSTSAPRAASRSSATRSCCSSTRISSRSSSRCPRAASAPAGSWSWRPGRRPRGRSEHAPWSRCRSTRSCCSGESERVARVKNGLHARPSLHLPRPAHPRARLPPGARGRPPLPPRPRRLAPLPLARAEGASRLDARLRRGRSDARLGGARRRGRATGALRGGRRGRPGHDPRRRAEPHGGLGGGEPPLARPGAARAGGAPPPAVAQTTGAAGGGKTRLWRDPELRARFFDWDPESGWYRRFFDIGELDGVRVEDPEIFQETHEKVLQLVREGLVDGLRIDHPDGLANPREYLERLRGEDVERIW